MRVMKLNLSKDKAISLFKNQSELARALGISSAAVAQWPDGKPIPEKQALKIRFVLKPEAFL